MEQENQTPAEPEELTPARYVRTHVFGLTQTELGDLLGATQASISRWEKTGDLPVWAQHKVRQHTVDRGLPWSDTWFFEVPDDA